MSWVQIPQRSKIDLSLSSSNQIPFIDLASTENYKDRSPHFRTQKIILFHFYICLFRGLQNWQPNQHEVSTMINESCVSSCDTGGGGGGFFFLCMWHMVVKAISLHQTRNGLRCNPSHAIKFILICTEVTKVPS